MSKYTTEVRYICESSAELDESVGYNDIATVIANSRTKIFNFDYPIYDEAYRSVLETKILKHYYTREIGLETVGLWKLKLDTKLNEIMPYYNQLYRSALLEFNPLYTTDLTREYSRDRDGSEATDHNTESTRDSQAIGNNKVTVENVSRDKYSDTPQGSLSNVENDTYLTNARKITNDNTTQNENAELGTESYGENRTSNNIFTNTEAYLEHVYGFSNRDASELLLKYRKTFLNIDMMIIDELEELFLHLW